MKTFLVIHLLRSGLAYVGEKDDEGTMFDSMLTVSEDKINWTHELGLIVNITMKTKFYIIMTVKLLLPVFFSLSTGRSSQ